VFWVQGFRFRVWGLGLIVYGWEFRVQGSGCGEWGLAAEVLEEKVCGDRGLGSGVLGLGFRVWSSGLRG